MWDMLLIGARFLQFSGALVLLGSALFGIYGFEIGAQASLVDRRPQWLQRVIVLSALVAMVGTILWVMSETVLFSEEPADGTNVAAVWMVFSETRFGRMCLWRVGLLLVVITASIRGRPGKALRATQVLLACAVAASFAWTGHGAMTMGGSGLLHLSADILHLLAAGIWIGALIPLAILVMLAYRSGAVGDAVAARYGLDHFSAIGTAVVAVLAVSGILNAWFLVGLPDWRTLLHSAYGTILLAKIGLFTIMLALAGTNRFWLTPRLRAECAGVHCAQVS
jgi:putative copper resistance protein D